MRSERVGNFRPGIAKPYHRSCFEATELEFFDIEFSASGFVSGEINLKAMIEEKAIDAVGLDPTSDSIGGLENHYTFSLSMQPTRCRQSSQASTNDEDVDHHSALTSHPPRSRGFSRYARTNAMSAGVIPLIRPAWSKFKGRIRLNFWRASFRRLTIRP